MLDEKVGNRERNAVSKDRKEGRWATTFWAACASALTAFMMRLPGRSTSVRPLTTGMEFSIAASSSVRNNLPTTIATIAVWMRMIFDLCYMAAMKMTTTWWQLVALGFFVPVF